jgi:sorting nexin-4
MDQQPANDGGSSAAPNTSFSSVSWSDNSQEQGGQRAPHTDGPGHTMDGPGTNIQHDPHVLGKERLDCTVGSPIKENDGTKDAFVSYLVTTYASLPIRILPLLSSEPTANT